MGGILLPVEGWHYCEKAFDHAKGIAKAFNYKIIILNVQNVNLTEGYKHFEDLFVLRDSDFDHISSKVLENAKMYFKDDDLTVELKTEYGQPAKTILDVSDSEECDMIIMCSHNVGSSKRFLLGSVTNKVVQHSNIPVLVIR